MALDTYTNLQSAVAAALGRDSDTFVTSNIADWVTLAEQRMMFGGDDPWPSDPVRTRGMEAAGALVVQAAQSGGTTGGSANAQTATVTPTPTLALGLTVGFTAGFSNSGATTLNVSSTGAVDVRKDAARDALTTGDIIAGLSYTVYYDGTYWVLMPWPGVPLPANFLGMRSLAIAGTSGRRLDFLSGDAFAATYPDDSVTGIPADFTIEADLIRLGPATASTYTLRADFWQRPTPLASASTNWLLTNVPGLYLYGTLLESAIWFDDPDAAGRYYIAYKAAVNGLRRANDMDRWPVGARQRPSGPTP